MQKIFIVFILSFFGVVACSSKVSKNPYKESHIIDVAPAYVIEINETPRLTKAMIDHMSETDLKERFSELQNQNLALTPAQKKEFDMIGERLAQLSSD